MPGKEHPRARAAWPFVRREGDGRDAKTGVGHGTGSPAGRGRLPGAAAGRYEVPAPEIAEVETAWINSKPLTLAQLRGRVVVVHFWTFG